MATVTFLGKELDPHAVSRILLAKPEVSAKIGEKLFKKSQKSTLMARTGTWFLTTESLLLHNPAAHLDKLIALVWPHLKQLRDLIPDLKIDLSLLVFDPDFRPFDLPNDLLSRSASIGDLEIEIPGKEQEILINIANLHEYIVL